MEIASKEYVDSKIVNTGQRKTITLDLIPGCSKQSLYLMSYTEGGTSGDDLENADYYMDVGFEGTVKLEKIGGGAISCYIRGYSNSCFTTDSRIYPVCVEDARICEGYLYIVVDNYIQPMGGVITIDITITGGQLRKVFEFTENLPPARDGELEKHVIALDTFRDSMIWCETDSYVLNHNYTERSLILGKRSKYTVPFTNIILTESREYVGAEYGRQLITNISTGERFIRTGIYDPIQNALVNVGESTFKYSYNQNTISKILASDTSVSDTVYVTGGMDNIGVLKKNSDNDVSVFSISSQGVLQGTLDSSGNLKSIWTYDMWQKYYYLVLDYFDDGNNITDITNKVVIWQKSYNGTYCGDVSTQLIPSNFYTLLQRMSPAANNFCALYAAIKLGPVTYTNLHPIIRYHGEDDTLNHIIIKHDTSTFSIYKDGTTLKCKMQ